MPGGGTSVPSQTRRGSPMPEIPIHQFGGHPCSPLLVGPQDRKSKELLRVAQCVYAAVVAGQGAGRWSQVSTRRVNPTQPGARPLGNLSVYGSQACSSFEGEIPPSLGHHEVYWGLLVPLPSGHTLEQELLAGGRTGVLTRAQGSPGIKLLGRGCHSPHTQRDPPCPPLPNVPHPGGGRWRK